MRMRKHTHCSIYTRLGSEEILPSMGESLLVCSHLVRQSPLSSALHLSHDAPLRQQSTACATQCRRQIRLPQRTEDDGKFVVHHQAARDPLRRCSRVRGAGTTTLARPEDVCEKLQLEPF